MRKALSPYLPIILILTFLSTFLTTLNSVSAEGKVVVECSLDNPFSLSAKNFHWEPGKYFIKLRLSAEGYLLEVFSGDTPLFKLKAKAEKLNSMIPTPVAYIERQGELYRIILIYKDKRYTSEPLRAWKPEAVKVSPGDISFETIVKGDFHQGIPKQQIVKLVLTTSLDWERAWNKYVNKPLGMLPPHIDFSKYMLVGICWQAVKGQWRLTIQRVNLKGKKLTIYYKLEQESPYAWSAPYHIVKIPKVKYSVVEFKPVGKLPEAFQK